MGWLLIMLVVAVVGARAAHGRRAAETERDRALDELRHRRPAATGGAGRPVTPRDLAVALVALAAVVVFLVVSLRSLVEHGACQSGAGSPLAGAGCVDGRPVP